MKLPNAFIRNKLDGTYWEELYENNFLVINAVSKQHAIDYAKQIESTAKLVKIEWQSSVKKYDEKTRRKFPNIGYGTYIFITSITNKRNRHYSYFLSGRRIL